MMMRGAVLNSSGSGKCWAAHMWSRSDIQNMSEATLRTEILIPLFKAMGFSDVFEYHGGPQEQGKDIVMWREDAGAVDRQNYSVVAKAQRITGKVEGGGGAGEVAVQVQQCFGRDP